MEFYRPVALMTVWSREIHHLMNFYRPVARMMVKRKSDIMNFLDRITNDGLVEKNTSNVILSTRCCNGYMADKISTDEFFSATSSNGYETYTHFADEILL